MFELFQPFDEAAQIAIQSGWHNPVIDMIMKIFSVANDHGEIWFAFIIALLLFKRTRKCGIALFFSLGIIFLLNQFVLKLLFERPRPYNVTHSSSPFFRGLNHSRSLRDIRSRRSEARFRSPCRNPIIRYGEVTHAL